MRFRLALPFAIVVASCTDVVHLTLRVPEVVEIEPTDAALGVDRETLVTAHFSEPLDEATVTPDGFRVLAAGTAIPGSVTLSTDGLTASFTADAPFAPNTTFTVVLDSTLKARSMGLVGFESTFVTRDRSWREAEQVSAPAADARIPATAFDAFGRGIAVWRQTDGGTYNIWASRYAPRAGWSSPQLMEDGAGDANYPSVQLAHDGAGFVVWTQFDGTRDDLWARRITSEAFDPPFLVEAGSGNALPGLLAISRTGDAAVAWTQDVGGTNTVFARRYVPQLGWEGNAANLGAATQVGGVFVDGSRNVTVVFTRSDGTQDNLLAMRFAVADGFWDGPTPLETSPGSASWVRLAGNPAGDLTVVWEQAGDIWANHFRIGTSSWTGAELVEAVGASVSYPEVAVLDDSTPLVVFSVGTDLAVARRGASWVVTDVPVPGTIDLPHIRTNGDDVAITCMSHLSSLPSVWATVSTNGAWLTPVRLETASSAAIDEPVPHVSANGDVAVIWNENQSGLPNGVWISGFR